MSGLHPTISAWARDVHEGYYSATLHDWKLTVVWSPNTSERRGSFSWKAERDDADTRKSDESFEEMEEAMAEAEHFAHKDAAQRAFEIARAAEDAPDAH